MTLNMNELVSYGMEASIDVNPRYWHPQVIRVAVNVVATLVVVVGISASAVLLVDHAHSEYLSARCSFFENDQELSEEEQLDRLLPFWSAFCLSYVPRSANFESKVLRRRIMCFIFPSFCKLATMLVVFLQLFVRIPFIENNGKFSSIADSYNIPTIDDANNSQLVGACFEALSFVALNMLYLRHQLNRPYISPRLSAVHGDPLNNAEVLTTRVLCWGAVLFCLRLFVTRKLGEDLEWMVTCLAVVLLTALASSQKPLFGSIVDELKNSLGSFGSFDAGAGRARGNSALSDIGVSAKIENMLQCKNVIEMWKLQRSLKGPLLQERERPRWDIEEQPKAVSLLRRAFTLLGTVIGAVFLFVVIFILTWVLSTNDAWLVVLALLLVGSVVGMEVYLARNVAANDVKLTVKEWAAKEKEDKKGVNVDDDIDDNIKIEMTENPVSRLSSQSAP